MSKKIVMVVVLVAILAIPAISFFATGKEATSPTAAGTDDTSTQSDRASLQESSATKQFTELKGEDYDRMFLANMLAHHQGAVDMAKLAQVNAKHDELKTLANDIITAQTSEVNNMLAWQKDWGYPTTSGDAMVDHSGMGMEADMELMSDGLKDKMGDEFDKAFLSSMLVHHQSAVDMSRPAELNALHQEIKDLARMIITAQTKEINQMKQWQEDWGYQA